MASTESYKNFEEFFKKATGNNPYPYQKNIAKHPTTQIIHIPTGAGKTEAAILGMWLWNRLKNDTDIPRRLIYCLPRRVLVEQTKSRVEEWLRNLGLQDRIGLTLLMGGSNDTELTKYPTKEYIIIGTQDMLISGALNRAYGNSPYTWSMIFGLLNNDCMWIMDEVQIMENALPTSIQLDSFRKMFSTFGSHHTVWMSATINSKWMQTVNSSLYDSEIGLTADDKNYKMLKMRNEAVKVIHKSKIEIKKEYNGDDISYLYSLHKKGTTTAIMVNTVQRAQTLYKEFRERGIGCMLVHSRFREAERTELNSQITKLSENDDRIIISTQVLEAGVDISVRTLITEIAPWSSLVQRFGRCNRNGTMKNADIYWIDIPDEKKYAPYDSDNMDYSRKKLSEISGKTGSPSTLPEYVEAKIFDVVLRKKDILDLFDTTPDLSGNYIDASRYVRTIDQQLDVDVFWRDSDKESKPERTELCSVSIGHLKEFMKTNNTYGRVWDYTSGEWEKVYGDKLFPGQQIMLDSKDGGYTNDFGWYSTSKYDVKTIEIKKNSNDAHDTDSQSKSKSQAITLEDHTSHVLLETTKILENIPFMDDNIKGALITAAKYHDVGKAHTVFQNTMRRGIILDNKENTIWAKSPKNNHHERSGFRHEFASTLAYLAHTRQNDPYLRDLTAYIIATHHGKIKISIRNISRKKQDNDYTLGIKTGEILPKISSRDISINETKLDTTISQIGGSTQGTSWTERAITLRDKYGPFRLGYMELLIRAADGLASQKEDEGAYNL